MKKWKPEKAFKKAVDAWWDKFTTTEKNLIRAKYNIIRDNNEKNICPYPDMMDVNNVRLSQLSDHQKYTMFRFKERY